jgi:tryptophan synthase alpha chain
MADRLARLLAGRGERTLVMPYLTAGYPDAAETVPLLESLEAGGADAVELGLPFSDPLADGPVIQRTSYAALRAGITHRRCLELTAAFRRRSELPVILMGYFNPILAYGPERFFADAAAAGADGIIVPDLPPEEAETPLAAARKAGLSWIFLAAPTSPDTRLARIDALSTDMSYCVSVTGVTGARNRLSPDVRNYLERARRVMQKPFVVGFGISRAEHVRAVSPPAAGVVVGSALLAELEAADSEAARRKRAERVVRGLRGNGA